MSYDAREFLDEFIAGQFVELELSLEGYGYLARLVPPSLWLPRDETHFILVSKSGRRLLYRKEMSPNLESVRLILEKEVDDDGTSEKA